MATTSRRLAKNSLVMYIRMIILMGISLYTSRIVLKTLGVDDYGIYSLVGSIVAMFNSLRTIFASSTQRYINYEMGRGDYEKVQLVFNLSKKINLIIAAIFVIIVEVVGLWFLYYKINVDPTRLFAAKCVFQLSIATSVVTILTTPYDAIIIAHERMNIFAYFSILEGFIKLAIVYLLVISSFDKLIFYAVLLFATSLLIRFLNVLYCRCSFPETKPMNVWDKEYFKQMTTFAGWNFIGNTAFALTNNGINMVLNVFGGPAVNAARGIAHNVNTICEQVLNNITVVINPFCVKTYASDRKEKFFQAVNISSKLLFTVQLCVVVSVVNLTTELLTLWLGDIPQYTIAFVQLTIINALVRSLHSPIDLIFKSIGDLKIYQIIENCLLAIPLVMSYFALKNGAEYNIVFIIVILVNIANQLSISYLASRKSDFKFMQYIIKVIIPCFLCCVISYVSYSLLNVGNIVLLKLTSIFISIFFSVAFMYYIGMNKMERDIIKSIFHK